MIKVLIADDHPIVRQGLKQIISDSEDIAVTGEAATAQETLVGVAKNKFDVVLLDISMPGRSGIEIIKEIREDPSNPAVLILTSFPEEQYAVRALKSGASGYMVKRSAPDELVTAIRKVSTGGKYISSDLAETLAFNLETGEIKPHEKLSNREYQVMCMIASGITISGVADKLSLSVKTISTHRSRILDKMGMKTNAELMHYAVKNSLA
ncbi:MAG: response regulator transcription factor [bacterium]|nr:response regulator transcription factor [bacterium]